MMMKKRPDDIQITVTTNRFGKRAAIIMSVLLNRALQQNLWPITKDNQYFVMYQSIFVFDTVFE